MALDLTLRPDHGLHTDCFCKTHTHTAARTHMLTHPGTQTHTHAHTEGRREWEIERE